MRIFIYNPDHTTVPDGTLSIASSIERRIRYKVTEPSAPMTKTILEETYDEAVSKLQRDEISVAGLI